ncbi:AraC family transcriptional regulator [Pseudonocardia sp. TRM90224]|uniref:AraC family transcriptional regulator n=1 Tax=Pseudonocardia sp. TRM90224 TaxID=2812678 RepID=UPI001E3AD49C|nr:helix-turn-helix domain-containing protein [Pseudonocardia sp. TRM90224]
MSYRELPPPAPLRGLVECGWRAEVAAAASPVVKDVLPDACMDLVWNGRDLLVAGPDTAPHPVLREPGVRSAGLRFAPGRLPALLGVPAAELRNARAPLAELHPRLAAEVVARIEGGAEPLGALAALTRALPGSFPEPALKIVLAGTAAGRSAAGIADDLGWTTRSLHRRCLAAFGYGPAVLRRVLRFRTALQLLQAGVPAAEVAAGAGYADQPHLSREVRQLAGVAPGQLGAQLGRGANRSTPLPSGSSSVA